jgi:hypothetical protein
MSTRLHAQMGMTCHQTHICMHTTNSCFCSYACTFACPYPVSSGGFLFVNWLYMYSDPVDYKTFVDATTTGVRCPTDVYNKLVKKIGKRFWMYVMTNIRNAGAKQLKYLMFVLEYKGLSRAGMDLLASCGVVPSLSAYDTWRHEQVKISDLNTL